MIRLTHNYNCVFRVSCISINSQDELARKEEDEYFYLSLGDDVFDNFFTFSKRLEEYKDSEYHQFRDAYDEYCQKKVHFVNREEKLKFSEIFRKAVANYYAAISNRVDESPILCPVVRVLSSLNLQISSPVWLFYEFQAEDLIGIFTIT